MISSRERKEDICKQIAEERIAFLERDEVEEDEDYLQIIPYVVFKDKHEILGYRRTKKSGESRLREKVSIGIGGHINIEDLVPDIWSQQDSFDYTEDFLNMVVTAAAREVNEEFLLWGGAYKDFVFKDKLPDYILYDGRNPVGRVHLGMVYIIETPHLEKILPNEDCIAEPFRFNFYEAWRSWDYSNKLWPKLEGWSKLVIQKEVRKTIL